MASNLPLSVRLQVARFGLSCIADPLLGLEIWQIELYLRTFFPVLHSVLAMHLSARG